MYTCTQTSWGTWTRLGRTTDVATLTREVRVTARGRPARFTRDGVVAAAEAVVRAEGIAALSMRRVARELGSSPMALYRHVAGRDELLQLLVDHIARDLRRPEPSDDPRRTVMRIATMTHDWLVQHPWVIDVLPGHRMGASVAWIVDDMLSAFLAAGLSPAAAARAYEVVWYHLVGELTTRHTRRSATAPAVSARSAAAGAYPTALALASHTDVARAHDQFLHGLSALLDGLLRPRRSHVRTRTGQRTPRRGPVARVPSRESARRWTGPA